MKPAVDKRSIVAAIVLIPLIALIGAGALQAKKKPPEWRWEVAIPTAGDFSVWGGQPVYRDAGEEDGVWAQAEAEGSRGGPTMSAFGLAIFKCEPGEPCYGVSPERVTLLAIEFEAGVESPEDDGPSCWFPGSCGSDPKVCMECFVNGEHPYWGDNGQPEHNDDYRYFFIEVTAPGDFEDLAIGQPTSSSGGLELIMMTDNVYLPTGYEDHHIVRSLVELPEGAITVTRDGEDTWTVDAVVPAGMRFLESYRGCGRRNPQGKCVGGWEHIYPLWADTASELHFQAHWTRSRIP